MLSKAKIDAYRRMTPEQRWAEVEELMTIAWRDLLARPAAERERILRKIRDDHEEGNAILLRELAKLK